MSSRIPRLTFDELAPPLAAVLQARVNRLGYLGEFFRVVGHQPAALQGFVEFTEAAKSALDKRHVEVLALTVASHFGNRYELNQHERLAVRHGFGRDWVAAIEQLAPDTAPLLSDTERLLQRFALSSVRSHGRQGQEEFEQLLDVMGKDAAVAVLLVISRYVAHAYMINLLHIEPPVPSIWDDGFAG
jgi:alkylhydroperoxidase family enzyme